MTATYVVGPARAVTHLCLFLAGAAPRLDSSAVNLHEEQDADRVLERALRFLAAGVQPGLLIVVGVAPGQRWLSAPAAGRAVGGQQFESEHGRKGRAVWRVRRPGAAASRRRS